MARAFDGILKGVFEQLFDTLNLVDCAEYPIKSKAMGKIFYDMYRENQSENTGQYRQFYDFAAFAFARARMSYSRQALDLWAAYMLDEGRQGTFVEIGAGDGIQDSVSALLEARYEWSGLLVEADPDLYEKISSRRQALSLPYAASDTGFRAGQLFTPSDPGEASLDPTRPPGALRYDGRRSLEVETRTYRQLCDEHGIVNVDFLSIATNGCECQILRSMDFAQERIALIRVEHRWEAQQPDIYDLLSRNGYEVWLPEFTQENFLFVHADYLAESRERSAMRDGDRSDGFAPQPVSAARGGPGRLELVSVHFPKTGGSSLLIGLDEHFGASLLQDYEHDPGDPGHNLLRPPTVGAHVRAVHGHFRGDYYARLRPEFCFTFIRDPIELLLSAYFFWRKLPPSNNPMHLKFLREQPSVLEFARTAGQGYVAYFGNMDLRSFDFIGRHSHYAQDMAKLGQLTGIDFPSVRVNITEPAPERDDIMRDAAIMAQLRDWLRLDYQYYDKMYALT